MPRSFKPILIFLLYVLSMSVFAQNDSTYKDVILDGKPAKLNVNTGEITLVKIEEQNNDSQLDSVEVKPKPLANEGGIEVLDKGIEKETDESDFYIVKKGDNLFRLSLRYNTSLSELKKANNLETTLIHEGQKLLVRNFDKHKDTQEAPSVVVVKKGDNLYRISLENGTTVDALKRINNLSSDVIKVGQVLKLK